MELESQLENPSMLGLPSIAGSSMPRNAQLTQSSLSREVPWGDLEHRNHRDTSRLSLAACGHWEMDCGSKTSQQRQAGGGSSLLFLPCSTLFAFPDSAVSPRSPAISLKEITACIQHGDLSLTNF